MELGKNLERGEQLVGRRAELRVQFEQQRQARERLSRQAEGYRAQLSSIDPEDSRFLQVAHLLQNVEQRLELATQEEHETSQELNRTASEIRTVQSELRGYRETATQAEKTLRDANARNPEGFGAQQIRDAAERIADQRTEAYRMEQRLDG